MWAKDQDLERIAREHGLDENIFDLANLEFLDWTTTMCAIPNSVISLWS